MKTNPAGPVYDPNQAAESVSDSPFDEASVLAAELAAQRDRYMRLAADFENFRKRNRRDAERQAGAEKAAFVHDLLPVLDNLERGLFHVRGHEATGMALQQLRQLLRRHGIEAAEDVGCPFDPHRQEAISVRHDPRQPDQVVLEVAQRGYCRGDEVFRPAKVVVNDLARCPGADDAR